MANLIKLYSAEESGGDHDMHFLFHKTSALLKIEKELFDLFQIYDRVYPGFGKIVHSEVISL